MTSFHSTYEPKHLVSEPKYFTTEQLALIDPLRVPKHVAIIPDGNRRWARKRLQHIDEGHREGADNLISIVRAAKELGVKAVTFYLFSTENWLRDQAEVQALMWLLEQFLMEQRQEMIDGGMRLQTIGELSALPESTNRVIKEIKEATAHCDKIEMIAALNYGSRDEIQRAFKKMLHDYDSKKITCDAVNEKLISSYLDTSPWGDPELLIRTSGEARVSNFLLWQISYAEIFIVDDLWPDFRAKHLWDAIRFYQSRERRMGGGA